MSMEDMMGKMLGPMIQPLIDKFEPQFKRLAETFDAMNGRTMRMEPAILELNNNVIVLLRKVDALSLEVKSYAGNRSAPGDADSAGDGDQPPFTPGGSTAGDGSAGN